MESIDIGSLRGDTRTPGIYSLHHTKIVLNTIEGKKTKKKKQRGKRKAGRKEGVGKKVGRKEKFLNPSNRSKATCDF